MRQVLQRLKPFLCGYQWYRRYMGSEWVHSVYFSEFGTWELLEDYNASPVSQRARRATTERWPVRL